MGRIIVTFIAVVLIIYLSYLVSKYVGKGMAKGGSSRYMRLLDQIALGPDRQIAVVQIGDRYLLVGITSGQINVLAEIEDEDLLPLSPDDGETGMKTPYFKAIMGKLSDMTKKGR